MRVPRPKPSAGWDRVAVAKVLPIPMLPAIFWSYMPFDTLLPDTVNTPPKKSELPVFPAPESTNEKPPASVLAKFCRSKLPLAVALASA